MLFKNWSKVRVKDLESDKLYSDVYFDVGMKYLRGKTFTVWEWGCYSTEDRVIIDNRYFNEEMLELIPTTADDLDKNIKEIVKFLRWEEDEVEVEAPKVEVDIVKYMNTWRKKYHNKLKNADVFWEMFFGELEKLLDFNNK